MASPQEGPKGALQSVEELRPRRAVRHGVGKYTVRRAMVGTRGLDRTAEGVAVWCQLDLDPAEPFGEELGAAMMEGSGKSFLIDLSSVTFMDSAGPHALLMALELPSGKDLTVQSSPQVFTLLHLADLIDGTLPNVEAPPGGSPLWSAGSRPPELPIPPSWQRPGDAPS